MVRTGLLAATVVALMGGSALAGPCTDRVAELGKSVTASYEGAGPALTADATTTGSTGQSAAPPTKAVPERENEAMRLLQQAKELDQQGKEDECMQVVKRVEPMAPAGTK